MSAGDLEARELITPLGSFAQPAGSHQQVMSPTQGYGTVMPQSSQPPGRDGLQEHMHSATPDAPTAGIEGGLGFVDTAAGRARASIDPAEGVQHASTTTEGGILHGMPRSMPQAVQPPDGSPGPEANTILRQDTLGDDRQVTDQGGDRGLGGIRSTGETAGVEGFMTPRSQGLPAISEMVEGIPGVFMSRVSEFFRVARTEVQAQSPPHHTRASPGAVSRVRALGDGSVGSSASPPQPDSIGTPTTFGPGPGRESPLLNAELLQRMQALEQRAPLLYPRSAAPERPSSRTESSSLPQEATQAEVARQLAGFEARAQAQEVENQRLRQLLERSEQRERSMREVVSMQAQTPSGPPLVPTAAYAHVEAPLPAPSLAHQVQDATLQVMDALRAPASASGFWSNLWSGLQGSQRLPSNATPPGRAGHVREPMAQSAQVAQVPGTAQDAQVPGTHRASSGPDPTFQPETPGLGQMRAEGANSGTSPHSRPENLGLWQIPATPQVSGGFASTAGQTPPGRVGQVPDTQGPQVSAAAAAPHEQPATREVPSSAVDALVLGVQQLQSLQAHQLKVKGDDAPEAVKPGITTLPKLVAPNPSGGSLEFQDWLELVGGLMSDVSDSSQLWWTSVLQLARDAFARWSVSSPVERLRVAPDDRTEIVEGKWSRVNARACAMLLDSLDASVKADIVARRATQNAAHIMFRLHTIYQPGGTNERDLILRNLHDPPPFKDVVAGVSLLRSWGRWHRRCLECGMVAPDPSILARGLTTVTSQHIARNPDVQFRTQVVPFTRREMRF